MIVQVRRFRPARLGFVILAFIWLCVLLPLSAAAAPYAAMVIDARTGEVLHSRNADTRLHPASLTKMMTLYIAFEAVRNGEIDLDTQVRITREAAAEPPSKLGLRTGQRIAFRYLIRAAAVKSANDAATAIGVALSGSEAAFARRMTRTAKAMGMTRTTFKNAHGLTESGHLSTARDMTLLGRHILYDYPEYYNLFSRRSTHAGIKTVSNTNRRLLAAYEGADGIKTGYTRAAGSNLVASAKRGNERVIATVFGGHSSAWRNARVAELLDMGFRRAPSRAPIRRPDRPVYAGNNGIGAGTSKTVRVAAGPPKSSLRPRLRPGGEDQPVVVAAATDDGSIEAAVVEAIVSAEATTSDPAAAPVASAKPVTVATRPAMRPEDLVLAAARGGTDDVAEETEAEQEVVTRLSTSGGHLWGINVGRYSTRYDAEKILLRTALAEMATLDGTLRKVNQSARGFDATFQGMTRDQADLACRRLSARNVTCFMIGPS
ncbi:D-alanyl-D-alanine carboxypeptidase [Cribrihabitans marinus]|uniref:D-alanyl-D-alanine carboxypeptidase n=1 Tax=Cribrihabitans marinus TaxID=1227549 RepID=A0A1H7CIQ7_9RHOB|nr:D-alanyl-D-alanine carboxypeptidase family protein [Cribrihabitans marinus]GGH34920.1 serine-type D-Ala-D-Ala carboxypeptidase [Cribrihabitans marinus]SEJ86520.1 D-alanyl-D-alanine carboxypeptidase [Cribrihabitans marinus]